MPRFGKIYNEGQTIYQTYEKICPAEPAGIETDSIKKGGSQGI